MGNVLSGIYGWEVEPEQAAFPALPPSPTTAPLRTPGEAFFIEVSRMQHNYVLNRQQHETEVRLAEINAQSQEERQRTLQMKYKAKLAENAVRMAEMAQSQNPQTNRFLTGQLGNTIQSNASDDFDVQLGVSSVGGALRNQSNINRGGDVIYSRVENQPNRNRADDARAKSQPSTSQTEGGRTRGDVTDDNDDEDDDDTGDSDDDDEEDDDDNDSVDDGNDSDDEADDDDNDRAGNKKKRKKKIKRTSGTKKKRQKTSGTKKKKQSKN